MYRTDHADILSSQSCWPSESGNDPIFIVFGSQDSLRYAIGCISLAFKRRHCSQPLQS